MKARRIQYNQSGPDQVRVNEFLRLQYAGQNKGMPIPTGELQKALLNNGKRRDVFVVEDYGQIKAVAVMDTLPSEYNDPAEVILFISDESFVQLPAGKKGEQLQKLCDKQSEVFWKTLIAEFRSHHPNRPIHVDQRILKPVDVRGLERIKSTKPFTKFELSDTLLA